MKSHEQYRFPLVAPQPVAADRLVGSLNPTELEGFMLALALVFNDLKGLLLFSNLLGNQPPEKPEGISGPVGEWSGLKIQLTRLLGALLHEFLELVREHRTVVQSVEFRRLVEKLAPRDRLYWEQICSIAGGEKASGDPTLSRFLMFVRNNVAYHYHQPKVLLQGFNRFFHEAPKDARHESAYVSLGRSMEESRFFYADAAAQACLDLLRERAGTPWVGDRLSEFIGNLNRVLMPLIREFIHSREE